MKAVRAEMMDVDEPAGGKGKDGEKGEEGGEEPKEMVRGGLGGE